MYTFVSINEFFSQCNFIGKTNFSITGCNDDITVPNERTYSHLQLLLIKIIMDTLSYAAAFDSQQLVPKLAQYGVTLATLLWN